MRHLYITLAIALICIGSLFNPPANAGTWRQTTITDFLSGVMDSTTVTDTAGGEVELALRPFKTLEDFMVDDGAGPEGTWRTLPDVSADSVRNFVVVWQEKRNPSAELGDYDIYAQRFTRDGQPIGGNFRVNDDTTHRHQVHPGVFVSPDGHFVIVWADYRDDGGNIYAQMYDRDGNRVGENFRVSDYIGEGSRSPTISGTPDGRFVVTWWSWEEYAGYDFGNIYAQRFDRDGEPVGGNFRVNESVAALFHVNWYPLITVAQDGFFVITWGDQRNATEWWQRDTYAQRYDSSGVPLGHNFMVHDLVANGMRIFAEPEGISCNPRGDFIITWTDARNAQYQYYWWDIFAQRYNREGARIGGNFQVSFGDTGWIQYSDVSVNRKGDYLIVWNWSIGLMFNNEVYYAQLYNLSGMPQLGNFLLAKHPWDGGWGHAKVTSSGASSFTIVWEHDFSTHIYGCQWGYCRCPRGVYLSEVADAGDTTTWTGIGWHASVPESTSLEVEMRASDSSFSAWDSLPQWVGVENGQNSGLPSGRWVQYRALLRSQSKVLTPILFDITLTNTSGVRPFPPDKRLPQSVSLAQNYPNPFNAETIINYQLSITNPSPTTLKIYNILGQEVRTLVDKEQISGYYSVVWEGRDKEGRPVASGVYFYRLKVVGDRCKVIKTRKMLLLR